MLWIGLLLRDMSNEKCRDLRVDAIDSRGERSCAPTKVLYFPVVYLYLKEERSQQWQLIYNKLWILGSILLLSV